MGKINKNNIINRKFELDNSYAKFIGIMYTSIQELKIIFFRNRTFMKIHFILNNIMYLIIFPEICVKWTMFLTKMQLS